MGKLALSLALLSSCWIGQALAEDACPPLTILTSVDMAIGGSGRVFVPAKIGGAQEYLLIDTGAFFSQLTDDAANSLQLKRHHSPVSLVGVSGRSTEFEATASFALGNLQAGAMDFVVALPEIKLDHDQAGAGGILGANLLTGYDLDLDFGSKKLNLLSQKHCDGKVVYWQADVLAVAPFEMSDDLEIQVPVKLDGHDYTAVLDTGASHTVLNLNIATRDFGLKPGDAGTPASGTLGPGTEAATYSHRFQSLSLAGVAVANPVVALLPDLMHSKLYNPGNSISNDARFPGHGATTGLGDMILGMDILHRLHLYIAYKEKKLYITPAAPAAGPPAQSPAPAPQH